MRDRGLALRRLRNLATYCVTHRGIDRWETVARSDGGRVERDRL